MTSVSANNFTCGDAIDAMNAGMIPCIRIYKSNGDLYSMLQITGMIQDGGEYMFATDMSYIVFPSISTTFQEAMDDLSGGGGSGGVMK